MYNTKEVLEKLIADTTSEISGYFEGINYVVDAEIEILTYEDSKSLDDFIRTSMGYKKDDQQLIESSSFSAARDDICEKILNNDINDGRDHEKSDLERSVARIGKLIELIKEYLRPGEVECHLYKAPSFIGIYWGVDYFFSNPKMKKAVLLSVGAGD